ncbi:MAG: MBOAT family protein [Burkholderiaceae bacterium]|nr:MBOAT family protein [Burkholderiaceae bacterium]
MVFSSITFLFYFFPIFLFCYYLLPWKNTVLLVASLLFYAWGEPAFVPLLICSAILNYGVGYAISRSARYRKFLLVLGICANLGILLYYKYFNFIIATIGDVFRLDLAGKFPAIVLPLGVSFLTFQGISYVIDVYRGDVNAQKSFWNFAMYKAMFPQLIAGPIVRYHDVADQITDRPLDNERIWFGFKIFVIGLGQKVLIANSVALAADRIFAIPPSQLGVAQAWAGIACYSIQILYDFGGYSNMAIGIGHMLGFKYPPNFNQPYSATSITEFWRRWHMSLSSWFRDYLYIPLGGNRTTPLRNYVNLSVVFLLCGLWHGAAWTFVVWGAWHGLLLVIERVGMASFLGKIPRTVAQIYTLIAVMVGWVFFRAKDLPHALDYIRVMFVGNQIEPEPMPWSLHFDKVSVTALVVGIVLATWRRTDRRYDSARFDLIGALRQRPWLAGAAELVLTSTVLLFCASSLAAGTYNPFIYFRF